MVFFTIRLVVLSSLIVLSSASASSGGMLFAQEDFVRLRFHVTFDDGPRAGDNFTGTLIYDDSVRLNGFGRRPLRQLAFTYEGKTYHWGDSHFFVTPDEGFVPEVQAGGSINSIPVIHYGLSTFVGDVEENFGIHFVPTTPTLGEYVEQSRLFYGSSVRLGGILGAVASFTVNGHGSVTYQRLAIPEPTTKIVIAVGAFVLCLRRKSSLLAT
jgi:hypothetical protein